MSIFLRRFFDRGEKGEADLIPPERPSAPRPQQPFARNSSIVDAEFREIAQLARDCAPEDRFAEVPRSPRAMPRPPRMKPAVAATAGSGHARSAVFWALVAGLSAGSFWLAGGHALAERLAGGPALAIDNVETRVVVSAGRQVLLVAGRIENRSRSDRPAPVVLVEAGGARHAIDTGSGDLAAGEGVAFEGRLDAPAGDAKVRISIVDMQAVQSGEELR
jgi:hypothetical protein